MPTGTGHSIGRWEGNTLVVDTVRFAPKVCDSRFPIMRTPGGGLAKETTHLEERIQVLESGELLSVTFTWDDPTVFSKPFHYTYKYRKTPEGYPVEDNDGARDLRGALVGIRKTTRAKVAAMLARSGSFALH